MKIFVLGNINSGKTYLINKLAEKFPTYKILKIDEYRITNCDGSLKDELAVWDNFPKEVLKYDDVIVELSGGGKVAENIVSNLDENSFIVLKVNTDLETCIKRIEDKNFNIVPYPKEFSIPIEEVITKIDSDIKEGSIENIWKKALNIIEINSSTDLNKLPLMQYHLLFKLVKTLYKFKGSLFIFGSTGSSTMNINSDIDSFFLTDEAIENILFDLNKVFPYAKLMGNQFVIRENKILVDVNYINDIKDAYLFYNRSYINNPSKTILKDDFNILSNLVEAKNQVYDKLAEIEYVKERLIYYVESLPKLIVYGDEYKYFFHNNIIVHEYVKLKAFLNDVFEYSYLPKNAKKYLKEEEWQMIIFNFFHLYLFIILISIYSILYFYFLFC